MGVFNNYNATAAVNYTDDSWEKLAGLVAFMTSVLLIKSLYFSIYASGFVYELSSKGLVYETHASNDITRCKDRVYIFSLRVL